MTSSRPHLLFLKKLYIGSKQVVSSLLYYVLADLHLKMYSQVPNKWGVRIKEGGGWKNFQNLINGVVGKQNEQRSFL